MLELLRQGNLFYAVVLMLWMEMILILLRNVAEEEVSEDAALALKTHLFN